MWVPRGMGPGTPVLTVPLYYCTGPTAPVPLFHCTGLTVLLYPLYYCTGLTALLYPLYRSQWWFTRPNGGFTGPDGGLPVPVVVLLVPVVVSLPLEGLASGGYGGQRNHVRNAPHYVP